MAGAGGISSRVHMKLYHPESSLLAHPKDWPWSSSCFYSNANRDWYPSINPSSGTEKPCPENEENNSKAGPPRQLAGALGQRKLGRRTDWALSSRCKSGFA
jgi:hypothetical protein